MEKFFVPNWTRFYKDIDKLSEKIKRDNFKPDIIVAIARGGWVVGRILSDFLDLPNVTDLHISFYVDINKTKKEPVILENVGKDVKDQKVLVVDDVSDTGESLIKAIEHLQKYKPKIIKTATVYIKPWTKFIPDYYVRKVDKWIIYPYEIRETIKKLKEKWEKEGKNIEWIKKTLIKIGINSWEVEKELKE